MTKTAFLFAGQGARSILGMGRDLYDRVPYRQGNN